VEALHFVQDALDPSSVLESESGLERLHKGVFVDHMSPPDAPVEAEGLLRGGPRLGGLPFDHVEPGLSDPKEGASLEVLLGHHSGEPVAEGFRSVRVPSLQMDLHSGEQLEECFSGGARADCLQHFLAP
jgi:hypothetical protein